MVWLRHHTEVMVVVMLVSSTPAVSEEVGGPVEQVGVMVEQVGVMVEQVGVMVEQVGVMVEQVGVMVGQVVEHHLPGCHLVIITTTRHSHVTSAILRHLSVGGVAGVVVEVGSVVSHDHLAQDYLAQDHLARDQLAQDHLAQDHLAQDHLARDHLARDHLLQHLWGDATTTCRGLVLDLTSTNDTEVVLRLVEATGLSTMPETVVVAVGRRTGVREVLLHHSLRNTLHALYLALHHHTSLTPPPHSASRLGKPHMQEDQFSDFMGHKFRVAAVTYFPYIDYQVDGEEPGSTVTLKDSVDTRLIKAFSSALNFTKTRGVDDQAPESQRDGRMGTVTLAALDPNPAVSDYPY
ncbi:uncharacterized protein [Procambarus clarkii]|uniref:uncharacterized protein n=1 Tax=Procambarus clarkii TaxID=6728 RepID=UPI003744AD9E